MAGEHSVRTNRRLAAATQVEEMHAVPRRERADRRFVDAEASLGAAAVRPADEATLWIAPAKEPAAGDRLRIERAAPRQP